METTLLEIFSQWLKDQGTAAVVFALLCLAIGYLLRQMKLMTRELQKRHDALEASYDDRIRDAQEMGEKFNLAVGTFQTSMAILTELVRSSIKSGVRR